jgi:hypothetical protein
LTVKHVLEDKLPGNSYVRIVQEDYTTFIDTSGDYLSYVSKLGKNTRYKMVNRRNYLMKEEGVNITKAGKAELESYFSQLNELHIARWNAPCFSGHSLNFHKRLAGMLYDRNGVNFSRVSVNGRPISMLYNLIAGGREYNIQSAFDENFKKNYSLGLVHLGIAVEGSFGKKDIHHFDLLAGKGKNEYFKSHFGNTGTPLINLQIIKSTGLKYIYKVFDLMPEPVKNVLRQAIK